MVVEERMVVEKRMVVEETMTGSGVSIEGRG